MSSIDYSKWDKMDYGSSSEEDESSPGPVRVTHLDQPSRVTTKPDGSLVVEKQQQQEAQMAAKETGKAKEVSQTISETNDVPSSWTEKGSYVPEIPLYWSQDRCSVTLRMPISSKHLSCELTGMLSYQDRCTAVASTTLPHLTIKNKDDDEILLESDLVHPVYSAEDDDEENTVDWSVEVHNEQRYVVLILYKATPMAGMTLWWRRPLAIVDKEIELDWRKDDLNNNGFAKAWDEAHKLFREKHGTGN